MCIRDMPRLDDGYSVTDKAGIPFWSYYQRHGPHVLGYPISQRFLFEGIVHQAFQKAILQWQHWNGQLVHMNTLDVLDRNYPDVRLFGVPPHQWLSADDGATFAQITANHLALLEANPEIRDYFLGTDNWLDRFGLPIA